MRNLIAGLLLLFAAPLAAQVDRPHPCPDTLLVATGDTVTVTCRYVAPEVGTYNWQLRRYATGSPLALRGPTIVVTDVPPVQDTVLPDPTPEPGPEPSPEPAPLAVWRADWTAGGDLLAGGAFDRSMTAFPSANILTVSPDGWLRTRITSVNGANRYHQITKAGMLPRDPAVGETLRLAFDFRFVSGSGPARENSLHGIESATDGTETGVRWAWSHGGLQGDGTFIGTWFLVDLGRRFDAPLPGGVPVLLTLEFTALPNGQTAVTGYAAHSGQITRFRDRNGGAELTGIVVNRPPPRTLWMGSNGSQLPDGVTVDVDRVVAEIRAP